MSAAALAALRSASDELALVDVGARARVAGRKLASGIFHSPVQLATGLPSLQPANDTWENRTEYDELAVESCFYAGNDPVNFVDPEGEAVAVAAAGGGVIGAGLAAFGAVLSGHQAAKFVRCKLKYDDCMKGPTFCEEGAGPRTAPKRRTDVCEECLLKCLNNAGNWIYFGDPWPPGCGDWQ